MNDFDDKISKYEEEINSLEYKRQALLARTVQAEMNLRNWDITNFFSLLDEHDNIYIPLHAWDPTKELERTYEGEKKKCYNLMKSMSLY